MWYKEKERRGRFGEIDKKITHEEYWHFCHTFTPMSYSPLATIAYVRNVARQEKNASNLFDVVWPRLILVWSPLGHEQKEQQGERLFDVNIRNQFLIWKVSFVEPCGPHYRYELITQNMDWMSALRYCRSRSSDTHLVQILDRKHQMALSRYLSSISCAYQIPMSVLFY